MEAKITHAPRPSSALKVLIVAEYYPRAGDPVGGVWAHRQAVAASAAGADVRVLVLHRPVPPLAALRSADIGRAVAVIGQPGHAEIDGLSVQYVRYVSPPRAWSYRSWGAWAAPLLARAIQRVRKDFRFDLIHAHYAVPAGDAVRRVAPGVPLVVSVHGHDVQGAGAGAATVRSTLARARLVLANSGGTARRCADLGARATRVVHLGANVPAALATPPQTATLVTVGHLAARKRHADVICSLASLRARHPNLRYVIVGDGPERRRLQELAVSLGVADRVQFRGQLPHDRATGVAHAGSLFVMPSIDEAFGVAYVEAMAAGVPAIGCSGEDGPEEIAAAGGGIELVAPLYVRGLARRIDGLLSDPTALQVLGRAARETVEREFTWERCGVQTVAAYREALAAG
jgi:teichuronic acid biosynthesis glycosyltransferase TuaC